MLNGQKAVVLGAPWADQLIVTARTAGGQRDEKGVSVFLVDKKPQRRVTRDYRGDERPARQRHRFREHASAG